MPLFDCLAVLLTCQKLYFIVDILFVLRPEFTEICFCVSHVLI